jgi:mannose-1-phosphate guanylyltransferase
MNKLLTEYSVADRLQVERFPPITRAPNAEKRKITAAVPSAADRCGIVLAGGEGKRLLPFIYRLRGDALPKQYVNFIGSRSMLEHTLARAERLIPPERLFIVVNQHHLTHPEIRCQLAGRPAGTVVVQPENNETGPGLLLPLLHVYRRYPDSTVTIFPSDHFIVGEERFMAHVNRACQAVEQHPSFVVMLGFEPSGPETEYGYILPSKDVRGRSPAALHKVARFIEKPERHIARELILQGGLWNSMVIAFKVKTMLDLVERAAPLLFSFFEQIREFVGTREERDVVRESYGRMKTVNFSKEVLKAFPPDYPSPLLVLPVRGVFWSDWGSEERISSVIRQGIFCDGALHGVRRQTTGFVKAQNPTTAGNVIEKIRIIESRMSVERESSSKSAENGARCSYQTTPSGGLRKGVPFEKGC